MKKYFRFIIRKVLNLVLIFFKIFKIKENRILFCDGLNLNFNGNSRYIYEELRKKNQYEFILIELVKSDYFSKDLKKLSIYNPLILYYLATSKIWFTDSELLGFLFKRKEQKYIQLWHAAGAFKKFGMSCLSLEDKKKYISKNKEVDLLTVSTDKVVDIYSEAFGIERQKIENLGIPRADLYFNEKKIKNIKNKFIENNKKFENKKIILYAPTFRGKIGEKLDFKLDLEYMKMNLKDLNYIIFLKLHPSMKSEIKVDNNFVFDFTSYGKLEDLMCVSDILITDYSSIIFEYSILKKPILFYAYDLEKYILETGIYYNYVDFIPGNISYTTINLVKEIKSQKWDLLKVEKFSRNFFHPYDGNSTKRIINKLNL